MREEQKQLMQFIVNQQQQIQFLMQNQGNNSPIKSNQEVKEITYDRDALWKEDYCFYDFINEFVKIENHNFSKVFINEKLIPAMLKVVRIIEMGCERCIVIKTGFADKKNPIGNYINIVKFSKFKSDYHLTDGFYYLIPLETSKGNQGGKEKCWTFQPLHTNPIFSYRQMDYIPYNLFEEPQEVVHKDVFNRFTGFKAQPIDTEVDISLIQPLLDHFKIVWAKGDEKLYNWILDWLAHPIQKPRYRFIPCLALIGLQGTGKTLPLEFVSNKIYGRHCSVELNNLDTFLCKFNDILANKIFCYVSETAGTSHREGSIWNKMDEFKTLITGSTLNIETKNVPMYTTSNFINWAISSNHLDSLRLDPSDRRFVVIYVSDEFLGNIEYFDKLAESLTDEAADHFYTFLSQREITSTMKAFNTQAKDDIKNLSLPNSVRFWNGISEWKPSKPLSFNPDIQEHDSKEWMSKQHFYFLYRQWCQDNGETPRTDNWFYRDLTKHGINYDDSYRHNNTRYIMIKKLSQANPPINSNIEFIKQQ